MIGETYPFLSEGYVAETGELYYIFLSQGEQVIPKLIAYTPVEKGGVKYFNWGFGDLIIDESAGEYKIDDKAESNNGDAKTVFYTVISTWQISSTIIRMRQFTCLEAASNGWLFIEG